MFRPPYPRTDELTRNLWKSDPPRLDGDMVTVVPTVHILDLRPNEQATIKRTSEVDALIRKGVLVEVDERPVFGG